MAKTPTNPRILTRKQLVGLQRERYLNRLLLIGTGIVVALVLGLVGWTWAVDAIIYPNQTVAVVEGMEIKGREFITRARLSRRFLVESYLQTFDEYLTYQQFFGDDPSFQQQYSNSLFQILVQLDPQVVGETTINQLVDEKLLALEAQSLGIEVSDEQIDADLREILGYFPEGTPTPLEFPTTAATSTLSETQYALVSPTPTASITPTASTTPEASSTSEEPASTAQATQFSTPVASATPVASPTATLSPTPYTLEGYEQALSSFYESYQADVRMTQQDIRAFIYNTLLREAIKDYITADLPRSQEQVWARHILVASEEEAIQVLDGLDQGEDWAALAAEVSLDESNKGFGGDLGWFPIDAMVDPFGTVAFDLSIGELSDPVETDFGWHIIQVLGHEDRPLDQAAYEQLREQKMTEFVQGLREKYAWEIFDNWQAMSPDEPDIPPQYRVQ
ncbi:MAG TPA: peptidylprolyl isomerase [Anaerolineales bacterium]